MQIRGLPFSTYAKFSGFLTPSLPLVRISRNLSLLLYAKIGHFINPPSPPRCVRTKWKPPVGKWISSLAVVGRENPLAPRSGDNTSLARTVAFSFLPSYFVRPRRN